jgi:hypothetical protein
MTQAAQIRVLAMGLLLMMSGALTGCATDSARPGTVCGHCDYRFSLLTPNPCDPCVPEVLLPGYGHTPTSWQVWSEGVVHPHFEPAQQPHPLEEVPRPAVPPAEPPSQLAPPTSGMVPPAEVTAQAMTLPDFPRPRARLR